LTPNGGPLLVSGSKNKQTNIAHVDLASNQMQQSYKLQPISQKKGTKEHQYKVINSLSKNWQDNVSLRQFKASCVAKLAGN
jgi:hypothetical protein